MNMLPLLNRAIKASGAAYRAGEISQDEVKARAGRLSKMIRRAGEWERRKERDSAMINRLLRARAHAVEAFGNGGRLVAFDTEYVGEDGPMEELGVCTYEKGELTTTTYRLEGREDRVPPLFGPVEIATQAEMTTIAQKAYNAADLVIFHAAHIDVEKISLDTTQTYYVDTGFLAMLWDGIKEMPKLTNLCAQYGIHHEHSYEAGNDAHRTLKVLIAMLGRGDLPKPFWSYAELQERRKP